MMLINHWMKVFRVFLLTQWGVDGKFFLENTKKQLDTHSSSKSEVITAYLDEKIHLTSAINCLVTEKYLPHEKEKEGQQKKILSPTSLPGSSRLFLYKIVKTTQNPRAILSSDDFITKLSRNLLIGLSILIILGLVFRLMYSCSTRPLPDRNLEECSTEERVNARKFFQHNLQLIQLKAEEDPRKMEQDPE